MNQMSQKRPFKICNFSRTEKKGIACSSLEELVSISRQRFSLDANCRVFLECDGTEVDNEEYFQFLPPQTLFMVTTSLTPWVKEMGNTSSMEVKFRDDSESQESYHDEDCIDGPVRLAASLKGRIVGDPMFFVSLSTDELHSVIDAGCDLIEHELQCSASKAHFYIDSCQQELDRRSNIKETRELLDICEKAIKRTNAQDTNPPGNKKPKT